MGNSESQEHTYIHTYISKPMALTRQHSEGKYVTLNTYNRKPERLKKTRAKHSTQIRGKQQQNQRKETKRK